MAKVLKNEIKYSITLCEEQKEAKRLILDNEIVIITGHPGVGKSAVVAQTCLDLLFKKQVDKILLARPTVEVGRSLGMLPGDLKEKTSPYNSVIIQSMKDMYRSDAKIDEYITKKMIKESPIQFIRGTNINEMDVLVVDEVQNTTVKEMEAIITRASGGRIILLGDVRQCDIKEPNGLEWVINLSRFIPEIKHIQLKENHRSGIVKKIIDYLYDPTKEV